MASGRGPIEPSDMCLKGFIETGHLGVGAGVIKGRPGRKTVHTFFCNAPEPL